MTNGGMFVEERKQRILERIERQRKATVAELCGQFRVSSATIRSDLRDLEAAGQLIRIHGGATSRWSPTTSPSPSAWRACRACACSSWAASCAATTTAPSSLNKSGF
jgi:DeoR/GlpR family transcriptional regulator of sugar metabolism